MGARASGVNSPTVLPIWYFAYVVLICASSRFHGTCRECFPAKTSTCLLVAPPPSRGMRLECGVIFQKLKPHNSIYSAESHLHHGSLGGGSWVCRGTHASVLEDMQHPGYNLSRVNYTERPTLVILSCCESSTTATTLRLRGIKAVPMTRSGPPTFALAHSGDGLVIHVPGPLPDAAHEENRASPGSSWSSWAAPVTTTEQVISTHVPAQQKRYKNYHSNCIVL